MDFLSSLPREIVIKAWEALAKAQSYKQCVLKQAKIAQIIRAIRVPRKPLSKLASQAVRGMGPSEEESDLV